MKTTSTRGDKNKFQLVERLKRAVVIDPALSIYKFVPTIKNSWTAISLQRVFVTQDHMPDQSTEHHEQEPSWIEKQWARLRGRRSDDVILAHIGEGADGIAVGKNIIQIGTFSIPLWLLLTGLLLLLSISLLLGYQIVGPWLPRTMPEGSFNIAVAEFTIIGSDPEASAKSEAKEISASIANFLKTQTDTFTQVLGEQVVVWGPAEGVPFVSPNEEANAAASLNADVLIYGQLYLDAADKWQVEPRFYLTAEVVNQATELYGEHALGNLIAYRPSNQASTRDVNTALQVRIEALSQLLLGLAYMAFGERDGYQKASETFLNTLNTSQWGSSLDGTGQEILHLFLGNSLLRLAYLTADELPEKLQLLNRSQAAFAEAINLNPTYARAYNGLAAALFQIARPPMSEDACQWDWDQLHLAEANFKKATDLPVANKPPSGYVDYYAYFGLGRVAFWNGYCRDTEKWVTAADYYQRALTEYAKVTNPIINLIDVAAYTNTDLGFMRLIQAEALIGMEDVESKKLLADGLSQSIAYYAKVFQLAQASNSDEVRQHAIEAMPYYLTALCFDHQGEKALDDLATFAEDFPDPDEVKTRIIELTDQDLWGECHAQAN